MNLKNHIKPIYELRLLQSSCALISAVIKYEIVLPEDEDTPVSHQDNLNYVERLYRKLLKNHRPLKDKYLSKLLFMYMFYSNYFYELFQLRKQENFWEKCSSLHLSSYCIGAYFKKEIDIYRHLGLGKSTFAHDMIFITQSVQSILNSLIIREKLLSGNSDDLSETEIKQFEHVLQIEQKEVDIIFQDINQFVEDAFKEVIFSVRKEYGRQIKYASIKNQILLSGYGDSLMHQLLQNKKKYRFK